MRFRLLTAILIIVCMAVGGLMWRRSLFSPAPQAGSHSNDPGSHGIQDLRDIHDRPGARTSLIHFTQMLETGIDFRNDSGNSEQRPFPAVNGNGIGVLDFDLDGNLDLYFATGRSFPLDQPPASGICNGLYRNLGDWMFTSVAEKAGVDHRGYSAGVAVGDFDSDGFPDIYLSCVGPNVLYRNRGDGTFESVGAVAGVDDSRWGTSAAFLDYDGDGLLDLYSCNYAEWSLENNLFCGNRARGVRIFCNPDSVAPERHLLYHNQSDGTFQESLQAAGIDGRLGRGQGVVAADINLDGLIDLYVSNDLQPNFLFLNAGGGRFRDLTEESGAAYDHSGRSQAGMGVDAADTNGDGLPELFVTNFEQDYNTLYENLGNDQFQDVSDVVGLAAASRPWVGWGTVLADFDGDGMRDIIVTDGHTDSNLAEMGRDAPYEQPPLVWRNTGRRFELVGSAAGDYFTNRFPGRALSIADLDNDGDPDIVIGHQDAQPALLRNDREALTASPSTVLLVRLIGRSSNRDAVGALVKLQSGSQTTYHQICGGRSYLSAHDLRIAAACDGANPARLEIRWPSGIRSEVTGLACGHGYAIIEPENPGQSPSVLKLFRWPRSQGTGLKH